MSLGFKIPKILGLLLLFTYSCKFEPNNLRSTLKSQNIYQHIAKGSVKFTRSSNLTSGNLEFTLLKPYACAIKYWSDDLNENPSETSPKIFNCTSEELEQNITFSDLETTVPYSFKIYVWPKALSSEQGSYLTLKERLSLKDLASSEIVFHNYNSPRQTGETYTFKSKDKHNLLDLRNKILSKYSTDSGVRCQESPIYSELDYKRESSQGDATNRPLHGLSSLATDGYAFAPTNAHPNYNTHLIHQFDSVERLQNMEWQFKWNDVPHTFTSFPPGYIEGLEIKSNDLSFNIEHRDLMGTLPIHSTGASTLEFEVNAIYPGQINFVHLEFKSEIEANPSLYCTYLYENSKFVLPDQYYKTLNSGSYNMTLIYESIQLHYKSHLQYPPWVITSQDWVHAKINKVL